MHLGHHWRPQRQFLRFWTLSKSKIPENKGKREEWSPATIFSGRETLTKIEGTGIPNLPGEHRTWWKDHHHAEKHSQQIHPGNDPEGNRWEWTLRKVQFLLPPHWLQGTYPPIQNDCNVGYAFINLINTKYIKDLYREFNGKRWRKFNS